MGALNSVKQLTYKSVRLFEFLKPTAAEYERKQYVKKELQDFLRMKWKNCHLVSFGSSENGFGFGDSDLDLGVFFRGICETNLNLSKRIELLREAMEVLCHRFHVVSFIHNARVPILKLWDPVYNISCDLSIGSKYALLNTALLRAYGLLDPRVKPIVYILKYWAKQRCINDPSNGTLSSYAYILMTIYFLQRRENGLIPCIPIPDEEFTHEDIIRGIDFTKFVKSDTLSCYGTSGHNSVGALISDLFKFYAIEFDYRKQVIGIRNMTSLEKESKWDRHVPWRISIEDPFEGHDIGRVVFSKYGQDLIENEFKRAYTLISQGIGIDVICQCNEKIIGRYCYICFGYGHQPRECIHRHSHNHLRLSSTKCWNCLEYGHVIQKCPWLHLEPHVKKREHLWMSKYNEKHKKSNQKNQRRISNKLNKLHMKKMNNPANCDISKHLNSINIIET